MSAIVQLIKDKDGFMSLKKIRRIPEEYVNRGGKYLSYRNIVEIVDKLFDLSFQATEFMYVAAFDMRMHVLGIMELGHGSEYEVNFELRDLFAALTLMRASRFVLIHNHVHDVTVPSRADEIRTEQVKQASELMGFQFLNHIIVGETNFSLILKD